MLRQKVFFQFKHLLFCITISFFSWNYVIVWFIFIAKAWVLFWPFTKNFWEYFGLVQKRGTSSNWESMPARFSRRIRILGVKCPPSRYELHFLNICIIFKIFNNFRTLLCLHFAASFLASSNCKPWNWRRRWGASFFCQM